MDTQEPLSSQDSIPDANDTFYSIRNGPAESLYAMLTSYFSRNINIEIYESTRKYCFGRENGLEDGVKYFVFKPEHIDKSKFYRISKQHFTLTFLDRVTTAKQESIAAPIVIFCNGRNGMYINDDKLGYGEQRILKEGDDIKLTLNCPFFRISYKITTFPALLSKAYSNYFIAGVIGSGGCGDVYLCYNIEKAKDGFQQELKGEFNKFALKIVGKTFDGMSNRNNDKIMGEVKIMQDMRHTHVLKLISYHQGPSGHLIILVPFMKGGDLLHRILNNEQKRLSEFESKYFFLQLLLGLAYMHKIEIAHRDIKCDNILLTHDGDWPLLKISDFGLSKKLKLEQNTICGTTQYCAPEILKHKPYTRAVDVWSSGVVLFAMLSGSMPFNEDGKGVPLKDRIIRGTLEFTKAFKNSSDDAKDIIKLMIQVDVAKRWDVQNLLKHSWLRDANVNIRLLKVYEENNCEDDDKIDEELLMKEIRDISIIDDDEPHQQAKRPRLC